MTQTSLDDVQGLNCLIAKFERRVELLKQVLELAQRQRKCVEQSKTERLDRLIQCGEHSLRQWRVLERELCAALKSARTGTLTDEDKARLSASIAKSEALAEAINRENGRTGEAITSRSEAITSELQEVRKARATLHAYAPEPSPTRKANIDTNA